MTTYTRRGALGLAGAFALAALAACNESAPKPKPASGTEPAGPAVDMAADDPAAADYQQGTTPFALAMLGAAAQKQPNAVVSPLSISQCMSLVAQGAAAQTLDQMAKALGCASAESLRSGANAEVTAIGALDKATLTIANTSFIDESFPVEAAYSDVVAKYFGVAPYTTDFADPAKATEQINTWVAERTKQKIPKLLEDGQVTPDTEMVLVNALYMKALWAEQFDPDHSEPGTFTRHNGKDVQTRFMRDQREVQVAQSGGGLLFALPYEDDDLEALFYLPPEGTSLSDAADASKAAALAAMTDELATTDAKLSIPTFEVRQRLELSPALKATGIIDAFDIDLADFSALSTKPTYVSFVQHEAWLKVGEKGTEGAAATASGQEAGAAPDQQGPLEIRLDRPFLFAVRLRSTNTFAFAAAINDPTK